MLNNIHTLVTKKRALFTVIILGILLMTFSFMWVDQVAAGSNGQQLKVNGGCLWDRVVITGKNQNGVTKTWSRTNTSYIPCYPSTVSTTGWWWVGNVTIRVTGGVSGNRVKTCYANVPKVQNGNDWYSVSCRVDY